MRNGKKSLALALVLGLILSCFAGVPVFAAKSTDTWDGSTAASEFSGGDGTETSPYLISNGAELARLAELTNAGSLPNGSFFRLTSNIDLNHHAWTPIGCDRWFGGFLDGNGHTISGLFVSDSSFDHLGLFGCINGSTIKDLTVSGDIAANPSSENTVFVGGIAAENRDGYIGNCTSKVHITGTASQVGGICGQNGADFHGLSGKATATLENCRFSGTIHCTASAAGGIVGLNHKSWMDASNHIFPDGASFRNSSPKAIVSKCSSTGSIQVNNPESEAGSVGGIAGENNWVISSSCNSGEIDTDALSVGGLAGMLNGDIFNCYNTGKITSAGTSPYSFVGGLIGVRNTTPNGLQGLLSTIQNCYNTGDINVAGSVSGGFIGSINSDAAKLSNCFYNSESDGAGNGLGTINSELSAYDISAKAASFTGLTGLTKAQMQEDSFTDCLNSDSASSVWSRSDSVNNGMPYLTGVSDED